MSSVDRVHDVLRKAYNEKKFLTKVLKSLVFEYFNDTKTKELSL